MASDDHSYEADRELWRKLYKTYIFNNDSLDRYWKIRVCIGMMTKKL